MLLCNRDLTLLNFARNFNNINVLQSYRTQFTLLSEKHSWVSPMLGQRGHRSDICMYSFYLSTVICALIVDSTHHTPSSSYGPAPGSKSAYSLSAARDSPISSSFILSPHAEIKVKVHLTHHHALTAYPKPYSLPRSTES